MNGLAGFLARALEADEREAVLGDLAERPQTAVRDVLGSVIRRQFQVWLSWQPWVVLVLATLPFAFFLSLISRYAADSSAIVLYAGSKWDWNLFSIQMYFSGVVEFFASILLRFLHFVCWSWGLGLLLGRFSRKRPTGQFVVFSLALFLGSFAALGYAVGSGRLDSSNAEVFRVQFYRTYYPIILLFLLGWLPALAGILHVDRIDALSPALRKTVWTAALLPVFMVLTQWVILWLASPIYRPVVWGSWWLHSLDYCVYWPALYWIAISMGRHRGISWVEQR